MYGKSYESMYEGSMIGAGINVFAVWNYIITKARIGAVEINPKLLAFTLGGTEQEVVDALEFLQRPDPDSRSKEEDGRRIIKEGQFQYRIVNWEKYQAIRNLIDKREYNRVKQQEYRAALKGARPSLVDPGDVEDEGGLTPNQRKTRVRKKIQMEEQVQEAVREKLNPEWETATHDTTP